MCRAVPNFLGASNQILNERNHLPQNPQEWKYFKVFNFEQFEVGLKEEAGDAVDVINGRGKNGGLYKRLTLGFFGDHE